MNTVKIELANFENDLAEFELSIGCEELVTCFVKVGYNSLNDFMNGELVLEPTSWYNTEEDEISKPEWFKRKELFDLNNVFENNFKSFI